jgi:hypothetical protein
VPQRRQERAAVASCLDFMLKLEYLAISPVNIMPDMDGYFKAEQG